MASGEDEAVSGHGPRLVWILLGLIVLTVVLSATWIVLQWSISESVYSAKAGLDWFGISFYHDYLFAAAALFSLLLIHPKVGESDLWSLVGTIRRRVGSYESEIVEVKQETKLNAWIWALWQVLKWAFGFYLFVSAHAFPFLDEIMNSVMMMITGFGNWGDIPRIFALPVFPASGQEFVRLMPSLEVQYRILSYIVSAFLLIFVVRMVLRVLRDLTTRKSEVWLKDVLAIVAAVVFWIVLGAPYWVMNIATPYLYGVLWTLFLLVLLGIAYLPRRRAPSPRFFVKPVAVILAVMFIIQAGAGAYYFFNWNNNYLQYEWVPQTQKQITVTRWAAGLSAIHSNSLLSLPTSNPSTILDLVRQWDQQAAAVTNTKEIGAYNWMALASSEIVFYNNTEYWVSPTTPAFPSTDWISEHLIYTHAAKVLVINTHNGSVVPTTSAFGLPSEPPIYYGEGSGFGQSIYVHVPGYDEVQNSSYPGQPDYILGGWQKSMWFTFAEGQLGFAFSGGPIQMLWNRNIFSRVGTILIPGLVEDPSAYVVSDGKNLYYAVQIYIDYPLQSGFSASPYLRFLGVVLVNVEDGAMQGYRVSSLIGVNSTDFITRYYESYYGSWGNPPSWLVPQLRYPEQLLGRPRVAGQLDYDFIFHVNDPFVFRSGTQFYERPENNTVQYIPWAVGNKTYFVGLQLAHFQSAVSKNLAGLYIAYGGDRLGQIDLYQNPSQSAPIIGPSAAENALTTNSQVRTQLTLLPNFRFGSYLLYSVGGQLTYFVAVYTNPGTSGVVTQLPFMTSVNPTTGAVGVGPNAAAAFVNLGLTNRTQSAVGDRQTMIKEITALIASEGYNFANVTSVNPTVWRNVGTVSFSAAGVNKTVTEVASLLQSYGQGSVGNTVYTWTDSSGSLNFGILKVPAQGVTEIYYVTIKP